MVSCLGDSPLDKKLSEIRISRHLDFIRILTRMLQCDLLNYCTSSAITVQWMGVVYKLAISFPGFIEVTEQDLEILTT